MFEETADFSLYSLYTRVSLGTLLCLRTTWSLLGCLVTAQDRFSPFIQSLSLLFPPRMQV